MKVLVIESTQRTGPERAGSGVEAAALEAAGHDVVRCADRTGQHECNGMPGGSGCPVEGSGVDVAVAVAVGAGAAGDSPTAADGVPVGVRCAVRHFVPLVTTGAVVDAGGQSGWGGSVSSRFGGAVPVVHAANTDTLAAAVVTAAGSALARHGELATAELRAMLAHNGIEAPDAAAVVHRIGGSLRVELCPSVPVDKRLAQAVAVRVVAALRSHDSAANGIGVVLAVNHLRQA